MTLVEQEWNNVIFKQSIASGTHNMSLDNNYFITYNYISALAVLCLISRTIFEPYLIYCTVAVCWDTCSFWNFPKFKDRVFRYLQSQEKWYTDFTCQFQELACIRKGEIMTVQTRIQTHALRISSQVLYQLGDLVPVIEPVFTVPQVEIVLKDIFLVLQIIFKIDFHV